MFFRDILANLGAAIALMTTPAPTPLSSGERLTVGQGEFVVQSPEGEGPVVLLDDETFRFTVDPGSQFARDRRVGKASERAEISSRNKIAYSRMTRASIDLRIPAQEAGRKGQWLVLSQLTGPSRDSIGADSPLGSPPFAIQLVEEGLLFLVRSGAAGDERARFERIGVLDPDFDNWHRYDIDIQLGTNGRVTVQRDGMIVIDWTGPVGYDAGDRLHYWKFGVYRSGGWQSRSQLDLRIGCAGSLEGCIADNP